MPGASFLEGAVFTPEQTVWAFKECLWSIFQVGVAWVSFITLMDYVFGGSEE